MVRAALVIMALSAAPAFAQAPDWRAAGGGLFVGDEAQAPAPAQPARPAPASAQPFDALVREIAAAHSLEPNLLHALLVVESAYNPRAVSPAGARGLAQLMPGTAADLGVRDPFDPAQNVRGGGQYLADMLARYRDVRLALAAYNAGPGRVDRTRAVPAIPETQAYVRDVIECFLALTAGRTVRSARDCRAASADNNEPTQTEAAKAATLFVRNP
jgi:soluble lytic murein transglycosylase-like protein